MAPWAQSKRLLQLRSFRRGSRNQQDGMLVSDLVHVSSYLGSSLDRGKCDDIQRDSKSQGTKTRVPFRFLYMSRRFGALNIVVD